MEEDTLMVTYRDDGLMNVWKCPPGGPLVSMAVVGSREELALAALGYEKRPWRHGNEGRYWKRIQSQEVLRKPCQTY